MCDWWLYDDLVYPFPKLTPALDFEDLDVTPVTYDEIRPGCWIQKDRLLDMDGQPRRGVDLLPEPLPRFCGQTFFEREDKELALLCVQAYNDWMIDEWCAGDGGPAHPARHDPAVGPAAGGRRGAPQRGRGCFAVTFSENPHPLGLPSVHDKGRHWDPFFQACEDTGTVVCMHIGSSSKMPATSPDAPFIVQLDAHVLRTPWARCSTSSSPARSSASPSS